VANVTIISKSDLRAPTIAALFLGQRFEEVPLHRVTSFKHNPHSRTEPGSALNKLMVSLREFGQLQPILVQTLVSGNYELVDGHRRVAAALLAGMTTLWAQVLPGELSTGNAIRLAHEVNLLRRVYGQKAAIEPIVQDTIPLDEFLDAAHPQVVGILRRWLGMFPNEAEMLANLRKLGTPQLWHTLVVLRRYLGWPIADDHMIVRWMALHGPRHTDHYRGIPIAQYPTSNDLAEMVRHLTPLWQD
jgi:hypothetical protein